jgi:3-hydroxybutyryl-CoA dehydratase
MIFSEEIEITEKMVNDFSNLVGDKNPIHLDSEYAKDTIFKKPIAHGMLISSFFSKMISETYPGHGSIYLSQSMKFLKPCYVGEKIIVSLELVSEINGKYEISTKIHNTENTLLVEGFSLVLKKNIN